MITSNSMNLSTPQAGPSHWDDFQGSIFHALLYTVFQKPRERSQGGVVIAISSFNPGEGVTFVTSALLHELARYKFNSVAGVNMSFMRKLHEPTLEAIKSSLQKTEQDSKKNGEPIFPSQHRGLMMPSSGPWESNWQYRRDCINLLRSEFNYTIIDCPAFKTSGDLLSIAPFVDGVIMVIEANRTRRDDPRQAEQYIATADGKLLGYILNKRTPEMPPWLDRMF